MRFFSFGGGRQSMAVLVLASLGVPECQFDEFIFSDVGHDSENPDTLKYFSEVAQPFAEKHGIKLTTVQRHRHGELLTLREYAMENNRSVPIPAFMSEGAPGRRTCTVDFKIKVVARHIRDIHSIREWTIGLGISTDEISRVHVGDSEAAGCIQHRIYPLIDLRYSLNECARIVAEAGLPPPPKSACYFCPFHHPAYWKELRQERPDLFADAVAIEKRINEKRGALGRDIVYLHSALKPLEQAVDSQANFFNELNNCESGYCMV